MSILCRGNIINFIHELFESRAIKQPSEVALCYEGQTLTYQELNQRANQLAHFLIELGVGPGDLIGICQVRSFDMVIAILAVLKVGATYVPIDPITPLQRLATIINAAKPRLILIHQLTGESITLPITLINVSHEKYLIERQPVTNVKVDTTKIDLAYVIFTSGTTGVPNGVSIQHRNLINLMQAAEQVYNFDAKDIWSLFHSYAFDFSVWEIWGALAFGGKLVIIPYYVSRTPNEFFKLIADEQVTILNQTPAAFYQFIEADRVLNKSNSLRVVILGGEAVDTSLLKPWFTKYGDHHPKVYNMYGITEVTIHATYYLLTLNDRKHHKSCIGKPLPNYDILLCDEQNQPVKAGEVGEICISGKGVAKGYFNNRELTKTKFIKLENSSGSVIVYKSGDLGYCDEDNNIVYIGRNDYQVKIRGFRIELTEIESILNQQPEVTFSVVIVKNKVAEKRKLIAFVQLKPTFSNRLTERELKNRLKHLLPSYMVPTRIIFISEIPLTTNGKVNREALLSSCK